MTREGEIQSLGMDAMALPRLLYCLPPPQPTRGGTGAAAFSPSLSTFRSPIPFSRSSWPQLLLARSTTEPPSAGAGDDELSDMMEELFRREENRPLLDGLDEASRRVDRAREALADIERQEAEFLRARDQVRRLENRKSEIAESQRELLEARAMLEEAQSSLSFDTDEERTRDEVNGDNREKERWESVKAATVSSIVGTLAGLPISLYQASNFPSVILHLAGTFISCALFGVTFRYAIRRDLDNIQLKTGTAAAFGLVKGLAMLEVGVPLKFNIGSFISLSVDGAVLVSENVFIFLFSAIALDFCFKMRLLNPFPIRK